MSNKKSPVKKKKKTVAVSYLDDAKFLTPSPQKKSKKNKAQNYLSPNMPTIKATSDSDDIDDSFGITNINLNFKNTTIKPSSKGLALQETL